MRNQFPFYFKRPPEEIKEIWGEATFSFDANVLLHLYRYSPETRAELIGIIDEIRESLWLPEQAAYEYLKNRPEVISEQIANLEQARTDVCNSKSKLTDQLKNKNTRSYPYYSKEAKEKYEDGTRALLDELDKSLGEIKTLYSDDPTMEKIANWFEGRTGNAYSSSDFEKICVEGEKRYTNEVPPGYADGKTKTKTETVSNKRSRYGDWLIWRQLMDYAKGAKRDVIFVTDDAKDDWWLQKTKDGEIFSPRPELAYEFHAETGQRVLIYSFLKFLKHGKTHLNFTVSDEADDETKTFNSDQVSKSITIKMDPVKVGSKGLWKKIISSNLDDLSDEDSESKKFIKLANIISSDKDLNAALIKAQVEFDRLNDDLENLNLRIDLLKSGVVGSKSNFEAAEVIREAGRLEAEKIEARKKISLLTDWMGVLKNSTNLKP